MHKKDVQERYKTECQKNSLQSSHVNKKELLFAENKKTKRFGRFEAVKWYMLCFSNSFERCNFEVSPKSRECKSERFSISLVVYKIFKNKLNYGQKQSKSVCLNFSTIGPISKAKALVKFYEKSKKFLFFTIFP